MHFYPHHIGDFIKDTANLNDHQLATYLRMIWTYYLSEKPFKDDCEGIAFAMRSDEKTVHLLLRHYFDLQEDGWHQKRCDQQIKHYQSNSEKGRKAAEARWSKNKHKMPNECIGNADARRKKDSSKEQTQSERNADAMHMHTKTGADAMVFDSNQEPITNNQYKETTTGRSAPKGTRLPSDWELPDEYAKFCREQRPDLNPYHVADQFKDYWHSVAGQKGVKADWLATWRNWIRNQKTENKKPNWADKQKAWLDEATGKTQRSDMKTIDADWDIFTTKGDQNVIADNRN